MVERTREDKEKRSWRNLYIIAQRKSK